MNESEEEVELPTDWPKLKMIGDHILAIVRAEWAVMGPLDRHLFSNWLARLGNELTRKQGEDDPEPDWKLYGVKNMRR